MQLITFCGSTLLCVCLRLVMNGHSADLDLVRRVRKKFENLEQTCMERYQSREQRVVSTLKFCITALEQLKNWAVFAIFPQDEQQSDKYVDFVEQRYQCVIGPLRIFLNAIERDIKQNNAASLRNRQAPRDASFEKGQERLNTGQDMQQTSAARDGLGITREPDIAMQSMLTTRDTGAGRPRDIRGLRGSQSARLRRQAASLDESSPRNAQQDNSLKNKINQMSQQYMEEGVSIKEAVTERLQKCRKDSRTLYRWGQASLLDLHDIVDESLADELYFMVRGKMARILSTISIFEEAADQIERNLSTHFPNGPQSAMDARNNIDLANESGGETDRTERDNIRGSGAIGGLSNLLETPEDEEDLDLRIEIPERDSPDDSTGRSIDDLMLSWSFSGGAVGTVHLAAEKPDIEVGRQSENSTPRSGSTPEPPLSPRPRALANHPKIMKLQSMALPSKFGAMNGRYSATW